MRSPHAWAWAGLALAMTGIAACQAVSGIANLDIVDDAGGDARASDATGEASGQGDATDDTTTDSTVEAAADGTADTGAETSADGPVGTEGGSEGSADAEGGGTDAGDASAKDASDSGEGSSDASDAGDASDASDASDGAVDGGCQFGWQCPEGYCGSNGLCAEPPSCVGLAATCGPNGIDDCCKSLAIQTVDSGVTYFRSYDGPNYTDASSPATLAGPFALDKYEVTVERFEKFIAGYEVPTAGSGSYPPVAGTGWNPSWPFPASQAALLASVSTSGGSCSQPFTPPSGGPPATAHLPVNCVDWYLAFAFCAWDGSRLPTEAEWNFAAAAGPQQRMYPWLSGTMPPPQIDSTFAWYNCSGGMGTMEPGGGSGTCNISPSLPVGSESPKGDSQFGQSDLAGSMLEPTLDFFGPYPTSCTNCVNTSPASGQRVYRGGSFMDPPPNLDDGYRSGLGPTSGAGNTGIRCAR